MRMKTHFMAGAVAVGLLTLATSGVTVAQSLPDEAETVAYILERCDGRPDAVEISGDIFTVRSTEGAVTIQTFDIRAFDFALSTVQDDGRIALVCPDMSCRGAHFQNAHSLMCDQPDRVLNALRHLQTLRGGPIEQDDPFA